MTIFRPDHAGIVSLICSNVGRGVNMDMYKRMITAMISKAINNTMQDNDFIVKAITELRVEDDSFGNDVSLHFEYEAFVWDAACSMEQITIHGCGYVSENTANAVSGAWTVEEGWN